MRILFLETKSDGTSTHFVDVWRSLNIKNYLSAKGWDVTSRKTVYPEGYKPKMGDEKLADIFHEIGQNFDVVFSSYYHDPVLFTGLLSAQKKYGLKIVVDVDDNILDIPATNTAWMYYQDNPEKYKAVQIITAMSEYVTCSTDPLLNVMRKYRADKDRYSAHLIPNMIDTKMYTHSGRVDDGKIRIGYQGSTSHLPDMYMNEFMIALSYILGKYPHVEFEIAGVFPQSDFEAMPHVNFREGVKDFNDWIKMWQSFQWDIAVAPLVDNSFNECKSNIKFLEGTLAGAAFIGSARYPYQKTVQNGVDGLLCETTKDWIDAFEVLINNAQKRTDMQQKAEEKVRRDYDLWSSFDYEKFFEKLENKPTSKVEIKKKQTGIGILTYNRPEYFKQCIEAIVTHCKHVDHIVVYNDGTSGENKEKYEEIYKTLPTYITVIHPEKNQGIAKGKNTLVKELMHRGCEYIFLVEEDIIAQSKDAIDAYIDLHKETGLHHFNFALHGPLNKGGALTVEGNTALYPHCVGAWSFYTREVFETVGYFDEVFKNVWEHVEHTARIARSGLTTPFWSFADHKDSGSFLQEIPESIQTSTIRKDDKWNKNIQDGLNYWKGKDGIGLPPQR